MQLMIDGGGWIIESDDLVVLVRIAPRRSVNGEATKALIHDGLLTPFEVLPEQGDPTGAVAEWVWDGTAEAARQLAQRLMVQLQEVLARALAADEERRDRVLCSLYGTTEINKHGSP